MAKVKLSRDELLNQLKEQISFLITSSNLFDQWKTEEAKRIAVQLRILLHDTGRSKSLLSQLDLKSVPFLNTATPFSPENLVSHVGLLKFKFHNPSGRRPWVIPRGTPDELPKNSKVSFQEWWDMPVVVARGKIENITFSRKNVVLHVANTDGGAHMDDALDKKYTALSKWNAIGIVTVQRGVEKPIENPILPCIRQIAHELLVSIQEYFPNLFNEAYEYIPVEESPPHNLGTGKPTASELKFSMVT